MMNSIGMTRNVDQLGRVVLPKEMRETLGIDIGDPMAFYTDESHIVLQKYQPGCVLCNQLSDLVRYRNRNVCKDCFNELKAVGHLPDEAFMVSAKAITVPFDGSVHTAVPATVWWSDFTQWLESRGERAERNK